MSIRPMLGSAITDYTKLTFPKYMSPKLDGIFCIIVEGVVLSRSGKPIRNKYIQKTFGKTEYNNLSGELIYGSAVAKDCFNKTSSFVMSEEIKEGFNEFDITLFVFDYVDDVLTFEDRYKLYVNLCDSYTGLCNIVPVIQTPVASLSQMEEYEQYFLENGYEGAILRNPTSKYKHGRSTEKSQDLLKVKRFSDAEAVVIGFDEKMHNTNEAKKDAFGHTERSTSKEGLVAANTLGALLVKDCVSGVEFGIGSGFDDKLRKEIWENKESWLGKIVKYQYFATGMKEETMAPRFPTFKGERSKDDM